ncbi:nucleotidyltransferase family protein [Carboxylicivirga sp. N1Y90]|uniref:nucleotidyltransferase family protein n=1 Tax=Carboxylicivirga fragile TaxID=3417571 RepID=UPI003D34785B|nr:nucleotidyltransferase family protein [Marinilabiliaceae bacterium N1Y90]
MSTNKSNTNNELAIYFESKLQAHEQFLIKNIFNNGELAETSIFDETKLTAYSTKNGVAPLLFKHKTTETLSDSSKKTLQNSYFKTLLNNTQHFETIKWIQNTLTKHNIEFLFLKGSLLAHTRYSDASLRPMSDIDFIVETGKVVEAYKVLMNGGASGKQMPFTIAANDHHLPQIKYGNSLIEIHQTLFPINSKYNIDTTTLFKHRIMWEKQNISIPGPSVAHTAIHVALHLYYTFLRGGLRLSWFCDLHMLVNDLDQINQKELNDFAKQHKLIPALSFVGEFYSLLSNKTLPNWPINTDKTIRKIDIDRVTKSFRANEQQDTRESYQLIIEQINEAKSLKEKLSIINLRLTKNNSLKGLQLLKHIAITSYRSSGYIINHTLKKLRLK